MDAPEPDAEPTGNRSPLARGLRFLAVNLLAVFACWIGLLVLTALVADVGEVIRYAFPPNDPRVELPNYPDKEKAREIFWGAKLTIEEYEPFVGWTRLPQETRYVNIGADGYRVHTKGRDAGPDAPSVGFFGGSTIWGTGVDDDSTIPAHFDRITRGYRVMNYAQGGHNARQNLALLMNLVAEGRMPDVVVFYNGHNHMIHCYFDSLNTHGAYRKMRSTLSERPRYGSFYHQIVAPPVRFVQEILRKSKKGGRGGRCADDPERAEQVAATLVRVWEIAHTVVTTHGGRFYAFLQPTVFNGTPRADHLTLRKGDRREQNLAVYPRVQRLTKELPYVTDLTHAFDVDEYVYIDDAHVTSNGNAIIARLALDRIEADGLRLADSAR